MLETGQMLGKIIGWGEKLLPKMKAPLSLTYQIGLNQILPSYNCEEIDLEGKLASNPNFDSAFDENGVPVGEPLNRYPYEEGFFRVYIPEPESVGVKDCPRSIRDLPKMQARLTIVASRAVTIKEIRITVLSVKPVGDGGTLIIRKGQSITPIGKMLFRLSATPGDYYAQVLDIAESPGEERRFFEEYDFFLAEGEEKTIEAMISMPPGYVYDIQIEAVADSRSYVGKNVLTGKSIEKVFAFQNDSHPEECDSELCHPNGWGRSGLGVPGGCHPNVSHKNAYVIQFTESEQPCYAKADYSKLGSRGMFESYKGSVEKEI
ncbi:hypothetical protein HMPREF3170_06785 [Corynebacterium sp. HMSC08D02]|uniref:hypothetical protein n=1 Tax=Corynebacterium sp. HMSC08D02 TaxID=1581138 RepID=UPI0008A210D4|nr:hypothetical protein [Corynebacterium sp. HMSC08D02]OFT29290.1 hypothetical protein HMPREF3170_06785 [Corynebacterium sp. HMSC08D02]